MMKHGKFNINTEGKDFFVGDLHGAVDLLFDKLAKLDFDFEKDRLFSVGDLIDRGDQSKEGLDLLTTPWFHAVKGNHEDMMLGGLDYDIWMYNGGEWWNELMDVEQEYYKKLATNKLWDKITVDTVHGRIGVIHADVFGHWPDWGLDAKDPNQGGVPAAIWGRTRHYRKDTTPVTGVEAVVVGHTPLTRVGVLGNVVYIDTGAVYAAGYLTVLEAKEVINLAG